MSTNLSAPVQNELTSDSQFLKYLEMSTQSIEMWRKSHSPDNASFPISGFLIMMRVSSEIFTRNSNKSLSISLFCFVCI